MDYRLQIARRYLASSKEISLISIITGISVVGVTLGVAALIVVLSVMNGFYDLVRDLMVSVDPHVRIVSADERGIEDAESLMEVARGVDHVEHASAYVEGKALLVQDGEVDARQVVVVRGVDPAVLEDEMRDRVQIGRFDVSERERSPGIVLDAGIGRQLGVLPAEEHATGSDIGLLSAPGVERTFTQIFSGSPVRQFDVRGLFEGEAALDESRAFVSIEEAQRLFRMPDRVTGIELRLDDLERADRVKQELESRFDTEAVTVQTWYNLQQSLYDVMQLEKWGATAILMLIIVVAAFNIVGSLTMVVIQKRRDVGVLRAMGVSRADIRRIFLLEGGLVGIVGTTLGLVIGLGITLLQEHFELVSMGQAEAFMIDAYPVSVQWMDVVMVVGIALALCVLAALYPAVRAAAIEPARAVQMDR